MKVSLVAPVDRVVTFHHEGCNMNSKVYLVVITSTCVFSFVYELEMVVSLVSSFPSLCLEFRHFGLYFIGRIRIHFSTIVIVHVYLYLSFPLFLSYMMNYLTLDCWSWKKTMNNGPTSNETMAYIWNEVNFKNQFALQESIQISKINLKFPKLTWISKINSNFRN